MEAVTGPDPQALLWQYLEDSPEGVQFVRDFVAESFVLPFYCAAAHLGIEIGDSRSATAADPNRLAWQEANRVDVMQVRRDHVRRNASEVAEAILDIAGRRKERFAK